MRIEIKHTYEIDWEKEVQRIENLFKGNQKKRLLAILDDFKNSKLKECLKKIHQLKEDKKSECSEREFLPMFICDVFNSSIGKIGSYLSKSSEIHIS